MTNDASQVADALTPAFSTILDTLDSAMGSGSRMSNALFADQFAQARKNIQDLNPSMLGLVDLTERFSTYLRSDDAVRDLHNVENAVKGIASAFESVFNISSKIFNNPAFQALTGVVANNPIPSLLAYSVGKNFIASTLGATTFGGGGSFGAAAGTTLSKVFFAENNRTGVAKLLTNVTFWGSVAYLLADAVAGHVEGTAGTANQTTSDIVNQGATDMSTIAGISSAVNSGKMSATAGAALVAQTTIGQQTAIGQINSSGIEQAAAAVLGRPLTPGERTALKSMVKTGQGNFA